MPFVCIFQLNNGALAANDIVIFDSFIDSAFGDFHSNYVDIARVIFNGKEAFISSTCPCFPSTKGDLKQGAQLTPETKIGYFSANGEDIPYKKPYAAIRLKE